MTKPRQGPLTPGEPVQLTDTKGRSHLITLRAGATFHTHRGALNHDDIIGGPDGNVVKSGGGTPYVVFRPLLADFTLAMKRGAAVVYPKDAAQIVAFADIFPGARVLEAGAGSGALSCWLLRAVGEQGTLTSFERRPDFAEVAQRNVEQFFGAPPPSWQLVVGDFGRPEQDPSLSDFDRIILDMLAPWECVDAVAWALAPGGLVCSYLATTTQLSRTVEALRGHGGFDEPAAWESLTRGWHVEGLAVRPEHRMVGHTGFLVTARRLAPGVVPPPRRRRPAKGAQDEDHQEEH
ncbi:MAG: tRNA (adenine-N1)-methyltransferase [Streptosporangiaceae bacterium]|jgi:tRNA (adenine57-N1/adenine58-N1)-methyltransferase